jgi:hypothetical protein
MRRRRKRKRKRRRLINQVTAGGDHTIEVEVVVTMVNETMTMTITKIVVLRNIAAEVAAVVAAKDVFVQNRVKI